MRRSLRAPAAALLLAAMPAHVETWHFLTHPDLVHRAPGPDRLRGTADDVADLGGGTGGNPDGAATAWRTAIFTGEVLDSFFRGDQVLTVPLPDGPGSAQLESNAVVFDVVGLLEGQPGDSLSTTSASIWTVGAGQTFEFDAYFLEPAAYRGVASGFVLYPGDNPSSVIGAGAVADNVGYLMTLLPATWQVAAFFDGQFTDLTGVPNGFGEFTGFMYTGDVAAVPLPGSVALLGAPLLLLPRCRRRLERHRVRRQT
ncbi:MAG: hypothetical protein H6977_03665 [Gammaproteobacteria bacterium]|nr:hypothetical protein [Gammaproteobacteria bacterium]MCP5199085.1 hypothetical protein [Gammaproteobacteria bacterium]